MGNVEIVEPMSIRLRRAMNLRNMKQVELAEITKIPKSSINQYLSGYATNTSTDRIYLMAKALDVNPVWLTGFDVPMESSATYNKKSADLLMDSYEDKSTRQVIELMNQMDDKGKEQVLQYATFILTQSQKA